MLNLLYCLLVPGANPSETLDRYVALRKKAPAVEMVYRSAGLKANLTLVPGRQMRLEAKGAELDYLCVVTPKGMRDIDRVVHQYDEQRFNDTAAPPSRISAAGQTFPHWILLSDLRTLAPKGTKFTELGRRTVGRAAGDAVKASFRDSEGAHNYEFVIDGTGVPIQVLHYGQNMMGSYRYEWNVDQLKPVSPPPASRFAFTVPDGYSPFSLDLIPGPAGVGSTFPLQGWAGGDLTGKVAKGGLIAILGTDSEPSRRAGAALAKIRAAGTPVVALGDAKGVPGTEGYDPNGNLLERLRVPSTPVFFKVDGKGKILAVWLGFDPTASDAFVREATGK